MPHEGPTKRQGPASGDSADVRLFGLVSFAFWPDPDCRFVESGCTIAYDAPPILMRVDPDGFRRFGFDDCSNG